MKGGIPTTVPPELPQFVVFERRLSGSTRIHGELEYNGTTRHGLTGGIGP
jgi:hypothetical protein